MGLRVTRFLIKKEFPLFPFFTTTLNTKLYVTLRTRNLTTRIGLKSFLVFTIFRSKKLLNGFLKNCIIRNSGQNTVLPRIVLHALIYETALFFEGKFGYVYKCTLPVSYSAACTYMRTRFLFHKKVEISLIYRNILYKFAFFLNFPYKSFAMLYVLSYNVFLIKKKACSSVEIFMVACTIRGNLIWLKNGHFWQKGFKNHEFWPFRTMNYLRLSKLFIRAPPVMVEKFRISIAACTYIRNGPNFWSQKSELWTHFWCMHHCLGFVYKCMHHNAGE